MESNGKQNLAIASQHVLKNVLEETMDSNPDLYKKLRFHMDECSRSIAELDDIDKQTRELRDRRSKLEVNFNQNEGAAKAINSILAEDFLKINPNPEQIDLSALMEKHKGNGKKDN